MAFEYFNYVTVKYERTNQPADVGMSCGQQRIGGIGRLRNSISRQTIPKQFAEACNRNSHTPIPTVDTGALI